MMCAVHVSLLATRKEEAQLQSFSETICEILTLRSLFAHQAYDHLPDLQHNARGRDGYLMSISVPGMRLSS